MSLIGLKTWIDRKITNDYKNLDNLILLYGIGFPLASCGVFLLVAASLKILIQ